MHHIGKQLAGVALFITTGALWIAGWPWWLCLPVMIIASQMGYPHPHSITTSLRRLWQRAKSRRRPTA